MQKRRTRAFSVTARYAPEPGAPTLEQVRAEAAPLVARLLAEVLMKRATEKAA